MRPFLVGVAATIVFAAVSMVAYDRLAVGSDTGFRDNPSVHLH